MLECLEAGEALQRRFARIYLYAYLLVAADGSDPTNQAAMGRAGATAARLGAAISFVEPEIASLPDGTVESYLSAEPVAPFRRQVERVLSNKPHLLSPETEKVLASLGELMRAPYTLYERAKSSDMRFGAGNRLHGREHPVSFATCEVALEKSADTVLRRNAYASFTTGLSV